MKKKKLFLAIAALVVLGLAVPIAASLLLQGNGLTGLADLAGGILGWEQALS